MADWRNRIKIKHLLTEDDNKEQAQEIAQACMVQLTHNGYQYNSISLLREEAIRVIKKLKEEFNINDD